MRTCVFSERFVSRHERRERTGYADWTPFEVADTPCDGFVRDGGEARPSARRLSPSAVSREQASSRQTDHEAKLGGEVEVGVVIARAAKHSSSAALLEQVDDLVQPVMDVE